MLLPSHPPHPPTNQGWVQWVAEGPPQPLLAVEDAQLVVDGLCAGPLAADFAVGLHPIASSQLCPPRLGCYCRTYCIGTSPRSPTRASYMSLTYLEAGPGCQHSMPCSYSHGRAGYSPGAGRLWLPWRLGTKVGVKREEEAIYKELWCRGRRKVRTIEPLGGRVGVGLYPLISGY